MTVVQACFVSENSLVFAAIVFHGYGLRSKVKNHRFLNRVFLCQGSVLLWQCLFHPVQLRQWIVFIFSNSENMEVGSVSVV